jgi:hypothetical protein
MKKNDKKQMIDCYNAEVNTNALDAKPSTANGFLRGYEKAFSLHVVMQQRELLQTVLKELDLQMGTSYSADENLIDTIESSL